MASVMRLEPGPNMPQARVWPWAAKAAERAARFRSLAWRIQLGDVGPSSGRSTRTSTRTDLAAGPARPTTGTGCRSGSCTPDSAVRAGTTIPVTRTPRERQQPCDGERSGPSCWQRWDWAHIERPIITVTKPAPGPSAWRRLWPPPVSPWRWPPRWLPPRHSLPSPPHVPSSVLDGADARIVPVAHSGWQGPRSPRKSLLPRLRVRCYCRPGDAPTWRYSWRSWSGCAASRWRSPRRRAAGVAAGSGPSATWPAAPTAPPASRAAADVVATSCPAAARPGDLAYPNGSAIDFASCYDPVWGQFRDQHPARARQPRVPDGGRRRLLRLLRRHRDLVLVGPERLAAARPQLELLEHRRLRCRAAREYTWLEAAAARQPAAVPARLLAPPALDAGRARQQLRGRPALQPPRPVRRRAAARRPRPPLRALRPARCRRRGEPGGVVEIVAGTGGAEHEHGRAPPTRRRRSCATTRPCGALSLELDDGCWQHPVRPGQPAARSPTRRPGRATPAR